MVKVKSGIYIALACLVSMPCIHIYALTHSQLKGLLAFASAGAGVAGAWACAERFNKQKLKIELHTQKIKVSELAQKLACIQSDQVKIKQDQEFLAVLAQKLMRVEQEYVQELMLFKGSYSEQEIAKLMRILQARIRIKASSPKQFKATVEQDLQELVALDQRLRLKISEWGHDNRAQAYQEQAHKLYERLSHLELFLKALQVTLDASGAILDLGLVLAYDYPVLYAIELRLQEFIDRQDQATYARQLDQYIRARYSEAVYQFPYLVYAEQLKKDLEVLQKAVNQAQAGTGAQYLQELETKAVPLVEFLQSLLKFVVTTPAYTKEKAYKPEFDRHEAQMKAEIHEKQERLTAELRESQARIDRERKLVEAQLQAEKNRAQELSNKKAELELERKNLELKDHQLVFELARIRDGETIKEAIKQNNSDWHYKYSALQSTNARLKDQLERNNTDHERALEKLRTETSALNISLKNSQAQIEKLTQKSRDLQEKIERSTDALRQLENYNPPFNPETIEGLGNYIRNIKSYARAARNALS